MRIIYFVGLLLQGDVKLKVLFVIFAIEMISKQCETQECLQGLCCPKKTHCLENLKQEITPLNLNFNRNNRISLKRLKNKQSQFAQFRSPPSQQITKQPSIQTLPLTPISNIPKISFSWSNPVIPQKQQLPVQQDEHQARQALVKKSQFLQLKRRIIAYGNSIVSIRSGSTFKHPRIEQSMIILDYFHPNEYQLDQMRMQMARGPLTESFILYVLHSFQINHVTTLLQRLHHNNARTVYVSVDWFVCVAVPSINQIDFSHVCDTSVDPGVFEIYVLVVETDGDNIMTVFKVYRVWSCVIIVFPGLNEHYYRSSCRKILFQQRNSHIFLYLCFKTKLQDSSMQFLRHRSDIFISRSQFSKVHLSEILLTIVTENSSEAGRTTSIVSGLVYIRDIENRYIFIASLESVVLVIFNNCCIVELGINTTYGQGANVGRSDNK